MGRSIVVVDDNPANLGMLFEYLSKYDFYVRVAQSARGVFEIIENDKPDLILLDIMMPDMDGFEVCRRLKQREDTRDIPVIFMSALTDTVDKLKGFYAGGVDYITKPFQTEEVLARVTIHLNLRNLQRTLEQKNAELREEIEKRKQVETLLRLQTHKLNERLKEVNCLYSIFALLEKPNITVHEILEGVIRFIPPAWKYSKIACARVMVQDLSFTTTRFKETRWKHSAPLTVYGDHLGVLEVFYMQAPPEADEGVFTRKEVKLLHAIAQHLSRAIERLVAEKELKKRPGHLKNMAHETYRHITEGK